MFDPEGTYDILPQAREDIKNIVSFLNQRQSDKIRSFLESLNATFEALAASPFLGSPQFFQDARHHSLRKWRVANFSHYWVFYRPFASGNGVEIWRVLHAAQQPLIEPPEDAPDEPSDFHSSN